MNLLSYSKKLALILVLSLLIQLVAPVFMKKTEASQLTEASIRLDRMGAGIAASTDDPILVVFKPTSTATEGKIVITWPTTNAFTVSSTDADHTTTTTGIPSTYQGETLVAAPTLGTPGAETTGVVTYTVGDLTAGTLYGFYITGGITNPATGNAGSKTVTIATTTSADAAIDSATVTVDTTTTGADLVTVTATVGSTFNFALGSNAIALGALSSGSISTGNVTIDIDSNAANGWVAFIRSEGSAATLASALSGDSIASTGTVNGTVETVSAGTENYVVDAATVQGGGGSGTITEATEYAGNGTTTGGTLTTSYNQIAQSTGQANSDTITLTALVAISTLTAAASDYTDTWEVVGAGNF
jgi:hypothetical protein